MYEGRTRIAYGSMSRDGKTNGTPGRMAPWGRVAEGLGALAKPRRVFDSTSAKYNVWKNFADHHKGDSERASYKELQGQIAELEEMAQQARTDELESAVQDIKALVQEYGIAVDDLNASNKKKGVQIVESSKVQFQDANGNTWSGPGRLPA